MTSVTLQRPRWLSVKEVALCLGIHEQSVRRKIAAGEIPALQLGGPGSALRVLEDELERWLFSTDSTAGFSCASYLLSESPAERGDLPPRAVDSPAHPGPEEAA